MQIQQLPLDETHSFSSFFLDYIKQEPPLAPFYSAFPDVASFKSAIANRAFSSDTRNVLVETLTAQYEGLETTNLVASNIQSLGDSNTFTVTTGHQLNIYTGPLYFIYKIVTVINACKKLKKAYPDHHFVPVYWMASEDHDFEEINHFYFQNEKLSWETDQTGAVGRFLPEGLLALLKQLPAAASFFREAYSQDTLANAVRHYVNHLFCEEGLVVVDADDPKLKAVFAPVIKADLFEKTPHQLVPKDTARIEELGYKTQVHCRECNFFYLLDGLRERIEQKGDGFKVLNTSIAFTKAELEKEVAEHPERFSPNVILRPLYQETILPNLAYVGGPSEAVYWLQLKSLFDHFKTPFPLLMPRNFALFIRRNEKAKWEKTGLSSSDLFLNEHDAFTKWVRSHTENELSFESEMASLTRAYETLKSKVSTVDKTLIQHLDALKAGAAKKVAAAEKKLRRAEKRKHADKKNQIDAVKDALFPNGSLQERRDNFLNFLQDDPHFVQLLLDTFDPFDYRMYLIFLD